MPDALKFFVTNGFPRRFVSRLMGRFSRIENRWLCASSIAVWKLFVDDLRLEEAKNTRFRSLHECFTRELREGARRIEHDTAVVVSPCDAIVGAHGPVDGETVIQAKGLPYSLTELLHDPALVERSVGGAFVTLRIKSSMYHRFHAPADCTLRHVTHLPGDAWNVDPSTVRRVPRLYCRNERAVLDLHLTRLSCGLVLVPVAAVLVAGIRLRFMNAPLSAPEPSGPSSFVCAERYAKGEEMGHFEHGSTIIAIAPEGFEFGPNVKEGQRIQMGDALLRRTLPV